MMNARTPDAMLKDNMQTNDAMRVQSPYYQAGTPSQITSPYNASTGSGPSPHPIGTPGLNASPCSGMENCNLQRAGFMQSSNVLAGSAQAGNMYAPGAHSVPSYGPSDDVTTAARTLTPTMHSQYSQHSQHTLPNSGQHARPSPSPSMPCMKAGPYPSSHGQHHMANSAGTDLYNLARPCSGGTTDVASPQTNIDPSAHSAPGGYPPGLPPGAPSETGGGHLMQRPNSRNQHQLYSSAPSQQNYCMPGSENQMMNGLTSPHNGSNYAISAQQSQSAQGAGTGNDLYGMAHHANGTQGYYSHSAHMSANQTANASINGAPQRLPTSMSNGSVGPYSSMMPQRMQADGSMMQGGGGVPGMTTAHQQASAHPAASQQYGAHHPGAPVPQPYASSHGRYMMPQSQIKPEMPPSSYPCNVSALTAPLPSSPASSSLDGAKSTASPTPSGPHPRPESGSNASVPVPVPPVASAGAPSTGSCGPPPSKSQKTAHQTNVPQDRFDGLSEDEIGKKALPDFLRDGLDIIIIGFNPSLSAAHAGHYYAGPGNHFWSCVTESGLANPGMTYLDDAKLPECGIGLTNMCPRPTKGAADLTREEIKEGIRSLTDRLKRYRPLIACFNGKGIYENFIDNKNFYMGKQPDAVPGTNIALFVMPSSSARCAQLPRPADKLPFYNALRNLRDFLKGRIPRIEEVRLIFKDYSEVKAFANAAENGGRGPTPASESSKRKRKRGSAAKNEAAANAAANAVVPAGAMPHAYHHHHPHARGLPGAGYGHHAAIMPPPVHPALPAPPPPPQYPGHMYSSAMMPRFHPSQQMAAHHPLPGISSLGQPAMHSAYYQTSMAGSSSLMGMGGYGHGPTTAQSYMAAQQSFYFPPYQLTGPPTHPVAAAVAASTAADMGLGSLGNGSAGSIGAGSNFDDLSLSEFLASSPSDSAGTSNANGGVTGMEGMLGPGQGHYFGPGDQPPEGSNPPTYTPL